MVERKNREVQRKNCSGLEKRSVDGDSKDDFMN